MPSIHELVSTIRTDGPRLAVQIWANDPRASATEGIFVGTPAEGWVLADLEHLPEQLRDEHGWGGGCIEGLNKTGGGIGADGVTVLSLFLGVVGAVPTVTSLLKRLNRSVPARPDREDAWSTATWAVAIQYNTVERGKLRLVTEARHPDHWVFTMALAESGDEFTVEVFGSRTSTVATRVVWTNGEPWGRKPGLIDPA